MTFKGLDGIFIKCRRKNNRGRNMEIVSECNDGFEGVKAIALHKPDLIFLDIQMPKINGFEMLELVENGFFFKK